MAQRPSSETDSNPAAQEILAPLMETEGSIPCSQNTDIDPILSQLKPTHMLTHIS